MSELPNSISEREFNSQRAPNADLSNGPYLHLKEVTDFDFLYSDKGTGGSMDLTIFRPLPIDNYFIIGDCAIPYVYDPKYGNEKHAFSLCAINDDPNNPMLLPPIDFDRVWTDRGTGGDYDGSLWWPIHPSGYVPLGGVCVPNYELPSIANYRCIREDLVLRSDPGKLIWNDRNTGAKDGDVAIYKNDTVEGAFVMSRGPKNPYVPPCYKLNPLFVIKEKQ